MHVNYKSNVWSVQRVESLLSTELKGRKMELKRYMHTSIEEKEIKKYNGCKA